jgi:hypothetical protein
MGGKAGVGPRYRLEDALRAVARFFEVDSRGVVIGGIAVIARGVPRTTRDIDLAFSAEADAATLVEVFARVGIIPRI